MMIPKYECMFKYVVLRPLRRSYMASVQPLLGRTWL